MVFDNVLSPAASNDSAAGRKQKYARWSSANDTWASLSFTVTITLVLAPVPPQSRPFNRPDYVRTKRPAAIEANRAITCRKNNARPMIPIVPSPTFYKSAERVLRSSELNKSFEKFWLPLRPSRSVRVSLWVRGTIIGTFLLKMWDVSPRIHVAGFHFPSWEL